MPTSIRIQRAHDDGTQTLGTLVVQRDGRAVAAFPCLELAWRGNENRVSCIPPGRYLVEKRRSRKFGLHLHVQDSDGSQVDGRAWILVHGGNRHDQILGCILPGMGFGDAGGAQILRYVPASGCPLYVHASAEHDAPGYDLRPESAPTNG